MKNKVSFASRLYMVLIFVFLYAPIAVMTVFSFNSGSSTYIMDGFSTSWWVEMFHDTAAMNALKNTVLLALATMVVSTVLGVMASVGLFMQKNKLYKKTMMNVTNIPMMNPEIVTGISMMLLFVFVGTLVNVKEVLGFTTLLIAHVTFCLPYVILNVMPKFRQFDMNVYEAAVDLGCKPFEAFMKVVMPEIMNGIITGCIMSFTLSLDDFIISYFVSGNGVENISIVVYNMSKRVDPSIYALSTVILVVILIGVLLGTFVPYIYLKKRGVKNEKTI